MLRRFFDRGGWWVVAQVLLLALVLAAPLAMHGSDSWNWPPHFLLGRMVEVIGGTLCFLGIMSLGSSLTPLPYPRQEAKLKQDGVFRWVRHPIYGGIVIVTLGFGLASNSPLMMISAIIVLVFFRTKAAREEIWLRERYPEYESYSRRTRMLIPGLY